MFTIQKEKSRMGVQIVLYTDCNTSSLNLNMMLYFSESLERRITVVPIGVFFFSVFCLCCKLRHVVRFLNLIIMYALICSLCVYMLL